MEEPGAGQLSVQWQQQRAADILRLLSLYSDLLDSYIIEFFTDNLWEKVPCSWRETLSELSPPQLAALLDNAAPVRQDSVWPLSLLAFRAAGHGLALPRHPHPRLRDRTAAGGGAGAGAGAGGGAGAGAGGPGAEGSCTSRSQSWPLRHLYRRHVKAKKQHEIRMLAALVKRLCEETGCEQVVDVGSGQGHLCRSLAFVHGLRVTGVEAAAPLVAAAKRFDIELQRGLDREAARAARRRGSEAVDGGHSLLLPRHLVLRVDPAAPDHDFVRLLETEMRRGLGEGGGGERGPSEGSPPFVLTALHACGDLGPATLRRFAACPSARGVATVSCCYMKAGEAAVAAAAVTETPVGRPGYPMSQWVRRLPSHQLPYKLREAACHDVEDFSACLRGGSDRLRTHVYRAALEVLIRRLDPRLKRPPLQRGPKAHMVPFPDYAGACLRRLGLGAAGAGAGEGDGAEVAALLVEESRVLAYTCLCLSLAPAIETLILLDRALYLREQGFQCRLLPLFDPLVSPRNFVLVAAKGPGRLGDLLPPDRGSAES